MTRNFLPYAGNVVMSRRHISGSQDICWWRTLAYRIQFFLPCSELLTPFKANVICKMHFFFYVCASMIPLLMETSYLCNCSAVFIK